jgi:hypothetical protein
VVAHIKPRKETVGIPIVRRTIAEMNDPRQRIQNTPIEKLKAKIKM